MSGVPDKVTVGAEGEQVPLMDLLGGRGFVTGKSGSGKSNTASVIGEELLECGLSLCIIDADGEYYGLKEEYELLHAGAGDRCDVSVGPDDAGRLAKLALAENVPVILDCSGYLEEETARATVAALSRELFAREAEHRKPFLLLVEEVHEFLPQGRGLDEAGDTLLRIAKRGRKRGLGLCGLSQRPAAVDKDFITQCDWLVWHRLTWKNDTDLVRDLLGADHAETVEGLDDGEALLQADWNDDIQRLRFRRKRTFDAGATPGLEDVDRPSLQSVDEKILAAFEGDDDEAADEDDPEELREEIADKNDHIAELEARIEKLESEVEKAKRSAGASGEADESQETDETQQAEAGQQGTRQGDDSATASAETSADGGDGGGTGEEGERSSAGDAAAGKNGTPDGARAGRESLEEPAGDDPVWELGQLTAHLARRGGRGISKIGKSVGETFKVDREDASEDASTDGGTRHGDADDGPRDRDVDPLDDDSR